MDDRYGSVLSFLRFMDLVNEENGGIEMKEKVTIALWQLLLALAVVVIAGCSLSALFFGVRK